MKDPGEGSWGARGRSTCRTAEPGGWQPSSPCREPCELGRVGWWWADCTPDSCPLLLAHLSWVTRGSWDAVRDSQSRPRQLPASSQKLAALPRTWGNFSPGQCPGAEAPGGSRDVYIRAAQQPGGADCPYKEEGGCKVPPCPPSPAHRLRALPTTSPSTLGEGLKASGTTPSPRSHCPCALHWGPAFCQ